MSYELEIPDLLAGEFQEMLLACLLRDRILLLRAKTVLEPKYFTAGVYRAIARALFALSNEIGGMPAATLVAVEASKEVDTPEEKEAYAEAVHRLAALPTNPDTTLVVTRTMVEFVQRARAAVAVGKAYADLRTFDIAAVQRELQEVLQLPALFEDRGLDLIEHWVKAIDEDEGPIFETGFSEIDRAMRGGARPGELILFQGPAKTGKTLVLQNMARGYYYRGHHVAIYTFEVYREDYLRHLWAAISGIPVRQLGDRIGDVRAAVEAMEAMTGGSITIIEMPAYLAGVDMIAARHEELTEEKGEPVVGIVDYAALVKPPIADRPEWQQIPDILVGLRTTGRRLGCPFLSANQTNAAGMTAKEQGGQHQSQSTRGGFHVDYQWGINVSEQDKQLGRVRMNSFYARHEASFNAYFKVDKPCRRLTAISKEDYLAMTPPAQALAEIRGRRSTRRDVTGLFS